MKDQRPRIAHIAFLVREYDEAIAYFTGKLGFTLLEDTVMAPDKRWVLVAPPAESGASLLLARAATEEQSRLVGNQAAGRVFLFLRTDDFRRDYDGMRARGVKFLETPREEAYGTVAVFQDLYGNKWDLLGPAESGPGGVISRSGTLQLSTAPPSAPRRPRRP